MDRIKKALKIALPALSDRAVSYLAMVIMKNDKQLNILKEFPDDESLAMFLFDDVVNEIEFEDVPSEIEEEIGRAYMK